MIGKCLCIFLTALLGLSCVAYAHRLNEYLQASSISLSGDHVTLRMHLTAGEAVAARVLAQIDLNKDGTISLSEEQAYASRVRRDITMIIDRKKVVLQLKYMSFPETADIKKGMGDILLTFEAPFPASPLYHQLSFENCHQKNMAVYLVNCLLPVDARLNVLRQNRNFNQSFYQLDFKNVD